MVVPCNLQYIKTIYNINKSGGHVFVGGILGVGVELLGTLSCNCLMIFLTSLISC